MFLRLLIVSFRKHELHVLHTEIILKQNLWAKDSQRASSFIWSEWVSGSAWGSEFSWCSKPCSDLWSWPCWWRCDSSSWSACRTSSSFSRMSFSVSLSVTPGTTGMGKSVPLSLVSLLQRDKRCREVQHLIFTVGFLKRHHFHFSCLLQAKSRYQVTSIIFYAGVTTDGAGFDVMS